MLTAGVETIRLDGVPTRITNPARAVIDCRRLSTLVDRETAVEAARGRCNRGPPRSTPHRSTQSLHDSHCILITHQSGIEAPRHQ